MKRAGELVKSAVGSTPVKPTNSGLDERTREIVNKIFISLLDASPSRRNAFKDKESLGATKRAWVQAFIENGITTPEQITRGLIKARADKSDFFPGAGKFISWCRADPSDLGMPPTHTAWVEVNAHSHEHIAYKNWSHAGVYEAGRRVGWFELRNGTADIKTFSAIYQQVVDAVAAGEKFTIPESDSTKLEHHTNGDRVQTEEAKKAGRVAIDELKKMF